VLSLTSPVQTPFHRVPAGPKLAALACTTVLLFQLSDPMALALATLVIAALYLPGGSTFAIRGLRLLRPLWPFALILALWHLWTQDIAGGLTILLRLLAALAAANLVTMTTRLSDMIAVTERLAAPLRHLGLPPRHLALAIALTIRFLPSLSDRLARLSEAWRARATASPGWRILPPAALATLDDADQVAEALRARGGAG
jgi:biotin transport system permease protein